MSNQSKKQQEELAQLIEEAHLNIIKAIASTYTSEQLEVALTLRKSAGVGTVDPFDSPPWDGEEPNSDE